MSREELIQVLIERGFTKEEADTILIDNTVYQTYATTDFVLESVSKK